MERRQVTGRATPVPPSEIESTAPRGIHAGIWTKDAYTPPMGRLYARLGLGRSSGAAAVVAVGLCLCLAGAALVGATLARGALTGGAPARRTPTAAPSKASVPASFAAKATRECRRLRTSLSARMPANVRRAANRIPGHATKAQDTLFGNFLVARELPAFDRAASRLEALGEPKIGRVAWKQFLTGYQVWVSLNEGFAHELQQGYEGYNIESRRNAWLRMKPVAALTGTTVCLSATG